MSKVKMSTGLASLLMIIALFAGWQTLLIVTAMLLVFAEVDNVKGIIVRVLAFAAGIALFSMIWGLIVSGYGLVYDSLNDIINVINSYMDAGKGIDLTKFYLYVLTPIKSILSICDNVVEFFITLIKFGFIVALLENKTPRENFISRFVNKYVDKVIAYFNAIETK